ncbi:hypothetical protein LL3_04185 [Bacillus amyloliquefaciens LL3]|nr:hypothetical protein LL3_04185 [Bacillus amyloliquefaciens LL3]
MKLFRNNEIYNIIEHSKVATTFLKKIYYFFPTYKNKPPVTEACLLQILS